MCVEVDTTSDEAGAGHFFNYVYQMTTEDKESAEYIYKTESSKYAFRGESTTDKKGAGIIPFVSRNLRPLTELYMMLFTAFMLRAMM